VSTLSDPHLEREQTWEAGAYAANARFVADLAGEVVAWLAAKPGERILDLGCGDGALTEELARAGAALVGIDPSASMVEAARARGLDARLGDGQALGFESEFDAVFSNAALHWMPEAGAVAAGVRRALKPGGRFVAEFGGFGNVAAIVTALRAAALVFGGDGGLARPWYFPTPAGHRAVLEAAGFTVRRIGLYPRPTPLRTGMEAWLQTFRAPFFNQFAAARRREVVAYVVDLLAPSLRDEEGNWTADYVRLRFEAHAR